ncbi:MAG: TonB C-terminal domain-containing protein [Nitrospira sp.]|nr:TonB C-terminal domain-containing protein [Nitrospira sp.]
MEQVRQRMRENEVSVLLQMGGWIRGVGGILCVCCILLSISCTSKGTPLVPQQAKGSTAPKAMADGTAPGSKAYLALVQQRIREVWKAPPLDFTNRTYVAVVRFRLHQNGSVSLAKIEQSSGNESYDTASQQAVLSASPFPVFPPDITHPYVDAHITLTAPSVRE